ncbi:hypothetical protein VTK73DRAFT_3668 [Phialemonium thermophilum]|uniref:Uncharacterized protein n=1 Tax=Phialemonium thermophilum TaxID=223376 RepID=A0ABR3VH02_9PEZI
MQQRGLTGGPSWSWASACGRIRMPREVEEDNSTLDVCMEVLALPRPGDVAASIHVRCVVLGGMKDDRTGTDNDDDVLQYSQAYYPDAKEDETREAKKKTRHLLAVKITYPGSLGWLLIRVEEVADHPRRRYRRLGVLELSAKVDHPVQVSADREAAMRACFQEVATETIELV